MRVKPGKATLSTQAGATALSFSDTSLGTQHTTRSDMQGERSHVFNYTHTRAQTVSRNCSCAIRSQRARTRCTTSWAQLCSNYAYVTDKIHTPRGGDTAHTAVGAHAHIHENRHIHISTHTSRRHPRCAHLKVQLYYGQVYRTSSHNQPSPSHTNTIGPGAPKLPSPTHTKTHATAREAPDTTPNKFAGGKTTLGTHRRTVSNLKIRTELPP